MEPSSTNYPNASFFLQKRAKIFTDCESKLFLHTVIEKKKKEIIGNTYLEWNMDKCERKPKDIGGYSEGVPPLPIPNREVKPLSADGTAKVGE